MLRWTTAAVLGETVFLHLESERRLMKIKLIVTTYNSTFLHTSLRTLLAKRVESRPLADFKAK